MANLSKRSKLDKCNRMVKNRRRKKNWRRKIRQRRHKVLNYNKALINMNHDLINNFNAKAIVNLTDVEIPNAVKFILSLGPKFNLPFLNKQIIFDEIISVTNDIIEQFINL